MQTPPLNYVLKQSCPQGFTRSDLEFIFTPRQLDDFDNWMFGQTQAICDGWTGKHHGRTGGTGPAPYEEFVDHCECHPGEAYWFDRFHSPCYPNVHGIAAYRWDVERYIEGGFRKAFWD